MGYVYVYGENDDDLSGTGLVGALYAAECTHEEIAGGISAITLTHPCDERGKWKALQRGNLISAECRVRTTPEIDDGRIITEVEEWSVSSTATKAQRTAYSKATKGKKLKVLKAGTTVTVVQKGAERYKIKTGKLTGWIGFDGLNYETTRVLEDTVNGIEAVAPPWIVRPQLFYIQDVELDTNSGTVTVYAPHISCALAFNNTIYKNSKPLTAKTALRGIFNNCDFDHDYTAYTDIGDTRTSCDWTNISPIEALLDPENGFAARWGAELVRDNYELYFLRRAGRNRGTRIEYGKNLLGVNYKTSDESVITAIKPTGETKKGAVLYLTDDAGHSDNYVFAEGAESLATQRVLVLACDDCTVDGKQITTALARERMREQAQRMFDEDLCHLPEVSLTVNFVQLGDTVEYRQYKDLEPVFLYDEVPVIDRRHGIEVMTDVHRILWDCLNERVIEVELGNVREGVAGIYSWQINSIDGGKLKPNTLTGLALADGALSIDKMNEDLQEALNKAWDDIAQAMDDLDGAKTLIDDTLEWLDTIDAATDALEAAVTNNSGSIAAIRLDADQLRVGLTNANKDIAAVSLTATGLQTAISNAQGDISTLKQTDQSLRTSITNAQGDISTLQQTATSMSSTVSSLSGSVNGLSGSLTNLSGTVNTLSGSVSSVQQEVSRITSTIYDANTGLVSQIQQLSNGIAVRLRDNNVNSSYELGIRSNPNYSSWSNSTKTCYGIEMKFNGAYYGGLFLDGSNAAMANWYQMLYSPGRQRFMSYGGLDMRSYDDVHYGMMYLMFDTSYSTGKRLRSSEAITSDSDRRLKKDIAEIEHVDDFFDSLKPRQYRMRNGDCLSFGFIAQDVKETLEALGLPETIMLSDVVKEDDYMGLNYQEFIALTVDKVQRMQKRMNALEERVLQLEG